MSALDRLIPHPRLREIDRVEIAATPEEVWARLRHGELAVSPLIRTLFALRELPDRIAGKHVESGLRVDNMRSSPEQPGFQLLVDDPPREFAVGAIGRVWEARIPFVHVATADAFSTFAEAGFIKVAWAIRLSRKDEHGTHVELEVRVNPTNEHAWHRFRSYFLFIGPASRLIRRSLLAGLKRDQGAAA